MSDIITLILGTALGACLGIPAGLLLDRILRKKADATRRQQLRAAILNAVVSNADVVATLKDWIQHTDAWLSLNVDLSIFEATASLKYEVLDDFELCQAIDHLRFELSHLARTLDQLLDLDFHPSAKLSVSWPGGTKESMYNLLRPRLIEAIGGQLGPISQCIEELKRRLTR